MYYILAIQVKINELSKDQFHFDGSLDEDGSYNFGEDRYLSNEPFRACDIATKLKPHNLIY